MKRATGLAVFGGIIAEPALSLPTGDNTGVVALQRMESGWTRCHVGLVAD